MYIYYHLPLVLIYENWMCYLGVQTIGYIKCLFVLRRIYNESNINPTYARALQAKCPLEGCDDNIVPLDIITPNHFDNAYYKNLLKKKGLLHTDQELYNGGSILCHEPFTI